MDNQQEAQEVKKLFKTNRVFIPILIGLSFAAYVLYKDFDPKAFALIDWNLKMLFWLLMAVFCMLLRDIGYIIRIRILSEGKISWRNSIDVILLWEYASAITPSVVGGTGAAFFIVNKEGINLGKTSSIVLITALMDEIFFVSMVPILFAIVGTSGLFPQELSVPLFGVQIGVKFVFWLSYTIIVAYVLLIAYGIIFNPQGLKRLIFKLTNLPLLRRLKRKALKTTQEIEEAAKDLHGHSWSFWTKALVGTFLSWTARYMSLNCIIMAFAVGAGIEVDNFLVYARQLVMWIIMLISPTPGGEGIAQFAFEVFLKEYTPEGLNGLLAILWRFVTYYPYLIIGAFILPAWIRRVFAK